MLWRKSRPGSSHTAGRCRCLQAGNDCPANENSSLAPRQAQTARSKASDCQQTSCSPTWIFSSQRKRWKTTLQNFRTQNTSLIVPQRSAMQSKHSCKNGSALNVGRCITTVYENSFFLNIKPVCNTCRRSVQETKFGHRFRGFTCSCEGHICAALSSFLRKEFP